MSNRPHRKTECNFYLASAYFKVGEYKKALKHVNDLLEVQPNNSQALNLKEKIEQKLTNGIFEQFLCVILFFRRCNRACCRWRISSCCCWCPNGYVPFKKKIIFLMMISHAKRILQLHVHEH